jgi:hypothetical protein
MQPATRKDKKGMQEEDEEEDEGKKKKKIRKIEVITPRNLNFITDDTLY